ncbi:hypothetical protein IJ579_04870 [bacterium]|nr:hypothetical protein [bacterium]
MSKIPPIPPINSYESLKRVNKMINHLGKNSSTEDYKQIKELAAQTCELAQRELDEKLLTNKFYRQIDEFLTKTFEKFAKLFNKEGGHKTNDFGKTIINAVLIGNILKDLMTGIISTSQSFTNPDYSREKRLFMGSYDVMACLTTVVLSFIFGPMSVNKITSGYKRILKPLEKTLRYNMVINGLSAFTAIVLQSIIAKRVIAPALSTPLAAKMKKKLEKQT